MKPVFAYSRVSTVKQGRHGSSLEEQKSAIEVFAKRHNLNIVEWFEETETAAKLGRRVFTRMLAALERGRADGVIIHKIDRSARNLKDWANLGELIDRGIEVHFAHESLDLNSRGGRLSADIQAVVAADFIRNLRQEVKKGFYGRLKQGLYPLPAPSGYRDIGRGKPKELDPIEAPIIRDVFRLYATGEYNFAAIRDELYQRGFRTRNGNPVSLNLLTTIFNNPFYIGIIHIKKTNETFPGVHPPLISKAIFDQVQLVLAGVRVGKAQKHERLFRRLVRCAVHGNHLIGETQKGKYIYYRCHAKGCGACVREDAIDNVLRRVLSLIRFDAGELRDLRDMVEHMKSTAESEQAHHQTSLRLRLAKCEDRLARLTDALIDSLIDKELFESRKISILHDRRTLLDQLEDPIAILSLADRVARNIELANIAYLSYHSGIPSEKRALVDSITSNFSANGKEPAITLKSPFQELADLRVSYYGEPRRDEPRTHVREILDIFIAAAHEELNAPLGEPR